MTQRGWAIGSGVGAVVLWFLDGIILCHMRGLAFWTKSLQAELWTNVLPNVVAGLGAVALAYFLFKETDRSHYVRAMRTIRSAIFKLRTEPTPVLTEENAQAIMAEIVPAISNLYYKDPKPPTIKEDAKVAKVGCLLCPKRMCPPENSRCSECKDIPPSWSVKEIR
jgi:hypothetical protein